MRQPRLLGVLLVLVAQPAIAQWVKVSVTDGQTVYVDPDTIKRIGEVSRALEMADLSHPGPNGARSMRILSEYDCQEQKSRMLQITAFSGAMGSGTIVGIENKPTEWSYTPPKTSAASLLQYACKR